MKHPVQCTDLKDAYHVMQLSRDAGYLVSFDRNTLIVYFWR